MKFKLLFVSLFILLPAYFWNMYAQSAPQGIPYQAVVRDNNGQPLVNSALTTRFTLHEQTPTGSITYQETHNTSSNNQGLIALTFGEGTPTIGTFSSINWAQSVKFLQVETDLGNGYTEIGTQQLMSVPYALFSGNSNQTNNSGQTLSTDSVLTLYSTVTQSSCDFVVPEGEAWKVVSINKNLSSLSYSATESFINCEIPLNSNQGYCYYTKSSTTVCQMGELIITSTGNQATATGYFNVVFSNDGRIGFFTNSCSTCPPMATFNYGFVAWSMPTWSLPVWCSEGQLIKSGNSIVLTIEKYK
jgi:hypothetical protein